MKNFHSEIPANQSKNKYSSIITNEKFKTTDINVLLNRVKIEKKSQSKKKIFYSIFIISIVSFVSFIVLGN